ncbi:hypothetical protein DSO57_1011739 [Entomophthora muscae]|uniref:Uncharacterized protein n=1 Tax=Entomophthora muscae TaxID=34485 RepID=A0ACC2T6E3_9FUNG|nr:hypothetical protein DSO57_1011739 [Entomophthora muscae]
MIMINTLFCAHPKSFRDNTQKVMMVAAQLKDNSREAFLTSLQEELDLFTLLRPIPGENELCNHPCWGQDLSLHGAHLPDPGKGQSGDLHTTIPTVRNINFIIPANLEINSSTLVNSFPTGCSFTPKKEILVGSISSKLPFEVEFNQQHQSLLVGTGMNPGSLSTTTGA